MAEPKDKRVNKCREFLQEILELMGMEAKVTVEEADDNILARVEGKDLGVLIGTSGRTLNALQDIVNMAVNKGEAEWRRVLVDVEGYREKRKLDLEEYAKKMADRALEENSRIALEPMNSFERRIVHMALSDNEKIETTSEGEDPFRRIVIAPKTQEKLPASD